MDFNKYYVEVITKNYANFQGRVRRKEFWMFFLFNALISFALNIIGGMIGAEIIGMIYSLAVLLPGIGLGVRRMHDVGKSGWFILIPIYNLVLAVTEGERKTNQYGPDPKAGEHQF